MKAGSQIRISKVTLIVVLLVILVLASTLSIWLMTSRSEHTQVVCTSETTYSTSSSSETGINVSSTFSFNDTSAKEFLESLDTPLGVLETFKGSNNIFIADDQALDCAALVKLGDFSLADNISSSANSYGGLYGYWNAVLIILNQFPANWNFSFPLSNYTLAKVGMYTINVTRFTQSGNYEEYLNYTDLELYYSLYLLHAGNYSQAVGAFVSANALWNGYGFGDEVYNRDPSLGYSSYRLAVDLIVYKALMANPNTEPRASSYNSTITQVESVMSKLQVDGGVITNYLFSNGNISFPANTYRNGETTSLFVLAK